MKPSKIVDALLESDVPDPKEYVSGIPTDMETAQKLALEKLVDDIDCGFIGSFSEADERAHTYAQQACAEMDFGSIAEFEEVLYPMTDYITRRFPG